MSLKCPKCGKPMRRIMGKHGPFVGCSAYPKCKTTIPLYPESHFLPKKKCDSCGWPIASRISTKGNRYYQCTNNDCRKFVKFREGAKFEKNAIHCPECEDGVLIMRRGPKGKFFGCTSFPQCRFTISLFHYYDNLTKKKCPECAYPLISRYDRRRAKKKYLQCTNQDCSYTHRPI